MSASVSDRHGSAHDPMCDDHHEGDCPWCNFAARVREDEKWKADLAITIWEQHANGAYSRALRDAIEAVKAALPVLVIDPGVPGFDPSERKAYQIGARYGVAKAAAAIEALGGER